MPERASGYGSYPIDFVSCQRERPVDGACYEVHKLIGIHLGTTVGSGLETIKELGLGAADVISHPIVQGGPHRGRSYVYCQDQLIFHTSLLLVLPNFENLYHNQVATIRACIS
jgi:hypothetical protein